MVDGVDAGVEQYGTGPHAWQRIRMASRRAVPAMVVCAVVGAIANFAYGRYAGAHYEANSTAVLLPPTSGAVATANSQPERRADTAGQIGQSLAFQRRVASVAGVAYSDVHGHLSVSVDPTADIVYFTASAGDPRTAVRVASAAASSYGPFLATEIKQAPAASELDARSTADQVGHSAARDIVVGAVLGLVIGILAAALLEAVNPRALTPSDAARAGGRRRLLVLSLRRAADPALERLADELREEHRGGSIVISAVDRHRSVDPRLLVRLMHELRDRGDDVQIREIVDDRQPTSRRSKRTQARLRRLLSRSGLTVSPARVEDTPLTDADRRWVLVLTPPPQASTAFNRVQAVAAGALLAVTPRDSLSSVATAARLSARDTALVWIAP